MTSFNNTLLSLPECILALDLKNAPLCENEEFLPNIRRFTHLVGLGISSSGDAHSNQCMSLHDLLSLAKHHPSSLQWFNLGDGLIDVFKSEIDAGANDEIDYLIDCIAELMSTCFPLDYCPVADFSWQYHNDIKY